MAAIVAYCYERGNDCQYVMRSHHGMKSVRVLNARKDSKKMKKKAKTWKMNWNAVAVTVDWKMMTLD